MGCSGRTKYEDIKAEQKWEFISLNDFKSTSCFTPLAYAYLYISLTISVAVYGVDTFTAVNLLAFDRWSGEISPAIPFRISKWIFSICIICSWTNLGFEYLRAIRVMRRGAVAESYLDSLAVRLQCIRPGARGRGWRRFLVFAELTKSKKGAEYVALFTYFSFQAWIRVIFCSGPRQVVNAITLYSVFKAKLGSNDSTDVGSSIVTFFKNLETLAEANHQQAVVLSGMIFTLIVWIFAAISLFVAMLFYIFFLWHYIPNHDNGLSGYCERKINSRLTKIVSAKVNKAIEEEERKKKKAIERAGKKGEKIIPGRQATLPTLFDPSSDAKLSTVPSFGRSDTMATLPAYTSRPNTPSGTQQPTVPDMELSSLDQKRPYMSRNGTQSSARSEASYASNAPLMAAAQDMGYGRAGSPVPSLPPLDTSYFPKMQRTNTNMSTTSNNWQQPFETSPEPIPSAGPMGPPRNLTNTPYSQSPTQYGDGSQGRQTPGGFNGRTDSPMRRMQTPGPAMGSQNGRATPGAGMGSQNGRNTPAAGQDPYGRSTPGPGRLPRQPSDLNGRATPGGSTGRPPFAPGVGSEMGRSSPAPGSVMGRGSPMPGPMMGRNSPAPGLDMGRNSPAPNSMVGRNGPAQGQEAGYASSSPSTRFPVNPIGASGPGPQRTYTPFSNANNTQSPPQERSYTPFSNTNNAQSPPERSYTPFSNDNNAQPSPPERSYTAFSNDNAQPSPPERSYTAFSNDNNAQPPPPERSYTAFSSNGSTQPERSFTPYNPNPKPPMRSASAAPGGPPQDIGFAPPSRNFTAPIATNSSSEDYFGAAGHTMPMRSGTPQGLSREQSPPDTYAHDVEAQRGPSRGPPPGPGLNRDANNSPAPSFQAYKPNNY